jgi:hypothetical protein
LEGLATEDVGLFCGHLANFKSICYILWPFVIFCGHLLYFVAIWYIFPRFGMLYQEKSGNPEAKQRNSQTLMSRFRLAEHGNYTVTTVEWKDVRM